LKEENCTVCKIEIDLISTIYTYILESICRWAMCETRKKHRKKRTKVWNYYYFFFWAGKRQNAWPSAILRNKEMSYMNMQPHALSFASYNERNAEKYPSLKKQTIAGV